MATTKVSTDSSKEAIQLETEIWIIYLLPLSMIKNFRSSDQLTIHILPVHKTASRIWHDHTNQRKYDCRFSSWNTIIKSRESRNCKMSYFIIRNQMNSYSEFFLTSNWYEIPNIKSLNSCDNTMSWIIEACIVKNIVRQNLSTKP